MFFCATSRYSFPEPYVPSIYPASVYRPCFFSGVSLLILSKNAVLSYGLFSPHTMSVSPAGIFLISVPVVIKIIK